MGMQLNKNGIPVQRARTTRKRVPIKLKQTEMVKHTLDGHLSVIVPDFSPVVQIMTAHGWEQREVDLPKLKIRGGDRNENK